MLRACHELIRQCKYFLSLWIILVFTNSVDPDKKNVTLYGISSGSSLFAKVCHQYTERFNIVKYEPFYKNV